jgi:hypothetical protein
LEKDNSYGIFKTEKTVKTSNDRDMENNKTGFLIKNLKIEEKRKIENV